MAKFFKRFFIVTAILLIILTGIVLIGRPLLTKKIEDTISQKIGDFGLQSKSVTVDLWTRSFQLDSIYYTPKPDTSRVVPHHLAISTIRVSGLHVLAFLRKKEVIITTITIENGTVAYNKLYTIKKDTTKSATKKQEIAGILIQNLSITNIQAALLNDTIPESSGTLTDLEIKDIQVTFDKDTTYTLGFITAVFENLTQAKKDALHIFAVAKLNYSSENELLEADSFKIIPRYSKSEFARVAKIQKTRLDIVLPKVIFEGVKQGRFFTDSTFEVTRIIVNGPTVHAYRDKHYPFVRDWIMPMPIEGIRRLPFKLKIDSIRITNANIAYEEFSDKGLSEPGTITFDNVHASFAGLSTVEKNPDPKAFCTLVADCKVMNSGILHATFKLPLNNTINYEATGSVRNMNLTSLNPALGNLTRISIRSGILKDLRFNFSYNTNVSTGEVLIQYESLKLETFKKDKGHEVNKVLTAVINTLVKTDKDKSMTRDERTGTINIERDKKRFVFQYWWKSLLNGLQSTFLTSGKKKKTPKESSK